MLRASNLMGSSLLSFLRYSKATFLNFFLLSFVHCLVGMTEEIISPCLNFYEYQGIAILCNNINLTNRSFIVHLEYLVSLPLEEFYCEDLAFNPQEFSCLSILMRSFGISSISFISFWQRNFIISLKEENSS